MTTQTEIIEMWGKAGGGDVKGMPYPLVEAFAKLVAEHTLMNIDPSKFISWQEGFEAGVTKEREACAKVCEEYAIGLERNYSEIIADKIRARGEA